MEIVVLNPDDLLLDSDIIFNTEERVIEIKDNSFSISLRCLYSFCKESWKTHPDLIKFPFPMAAITEDVFNMTYGWTFSPGSENLLRHGHCFSDGKEIINDLNFHWNDASEVKPDNSYPVLVRIYNNLDSSTSYHTSIYDIPSKSFEIGIYTESSLGKVTHWKEIIEPFIPFA